MSLRATKWRSNLDQSKEVATSWRFGATPRNDEITLQPSFLPTPTLLHGRQRVDVDDAIDTIIGIPLLPFGGIKDSGFGRTHGQEGLMQFTRPFSYAVGGVPIKWDIATILRENGHYNLASAIMGVIYGTTLRQKWETLSQLFRRKPGAQSQNISVQSKAD